MDFIIQKVAEVLFEQAKGTTLDPAIKTVLVFRAAGQGKTSFVNALTGQRLAVGNGAEGVTLESATVSVWRNSVKYHIIDTVGLNGAGHGQTSGK
jgi:predicted GTPase